MMRRRIRPPAPGAGFPLLFAVVAVSCATAGETRHSAAAAPSPDQRSELEQTRIRVMRFADFAAVEIRKATEAFSVLVGTNEGRMQALTWRINYTHTLWRIASGPRPYANLLDTARAISTARKAHETHWRSTWGEADRPMLEVLTHLEGAIWALAAEVSDRESVAATRQIVDEWLERNPDRHIADLASLPEFVEIARQQDQTPGTKSLLGAIGLDPLNGLAPAVMEVEQSRLLAERVIYYYQHLDELVSARIELLMLRSATLPETKTALADWDRFATAAERISTTAQALPATLTAEREAAIAQFFDEVSMQREGLIRDLETAREPLTALLHDSRGTAEAGRDMSQALEAAVRAADELSARLIAARDARSPGRRFNITEYTATAESIGRAARDMTATLQAFSTNLPEIQRLVQEAGTRADQSLDLAFTRSERTVDYAFRRALQLLGAALVGAAITALAVRRISFHWGAPPRRPGGS